MASGLSTPSTATWLTVLVATVASGQLSTPGPLAGERSLSLLFRYMHANLSGHRCDFDRLDLCALRGSAGVWSFQRSLAEFADRMQQAARDAADAEAKLVDRRTGDNNKFGEPYSSFQPLQTSVKVPAVNYFPCSADVAPRTASSENSTGPVSSLVLSLPWLQLVRMPTAMIPPEDATEVSDHTVALPQRAPGSTYPPLACLSVDVRFPPGGEGRFSVAFSSLIQSLHNDAPENLPIPGTPLSPRQPDPLLTLSSQATTTSKISSLSHRLPANTWITFMAPVHLDFSTQSADQSGLTFITDQHNVPLTFHTGSNTQETWTAIAVRSALQLNASQGVCIDNVHLLPFVNTSHARSAGRLHCQRQLQWLEPTTSVRSIVYLDDSGNPLPITDSPVQLTPLFPGSFLSAHYANLSSGGSPLFNWIPFSGSLILALSATFLFLCLCLTISLSVMLARRRRRPPSAPHRKRHSNGPLLYSPPSGPSAGTKLNWIAANSLFCTDEHLSTLGSGNRSMPQCELSLPLNELLILSEGEGCDSTERTSDTNPSLQLSTAPEQQPLDETVDPAITSAWQFMRNLRFHRRKGGRLLKQLDARSRAVVSRPQPPSLHHEVPRRPLPIYRRPAMNMNPPSVANNASGAHNESTGTDFEPVNVLRRTRGNASVASGTPYRHSLMLSVNRDNELVIRPMEPAADCAHVIGNTGSLPCGGATAAQRQEPPEFPPRTSDTSDAASHDQQTTPSTVARSMLPSDGSGPPSYADSSEAG